MFVVYEFRPDLARLKEHFPKARELKKQREEKDWNQDDGTLALILIYPQSAEHGITLQHSWNIAWFSHSFNLETFEQVHERLGVVRQMRSGYDRAVQKFYFVTRHG